MKQNLIKNHPSSKQIQIKSQNGGKYSALDGSKKFSPLTTSVLSQKNVYRANNKSR